MLQNIATILFLSGEPVTFAAIAKLCDTSIEDVKQSLPQLIAHLTPIGLSLLINKEEVSIATAASAAPLVEKFWKEELRGELTSATLQVLTLVAYIGPCSRNDISFIRGVQSSQSIRTLSVRGLIDKQGETCSLSSEAMKYLGVLKAEDLPEYETIRKELLDKLSIARTE